MVLCSAPNVWLSIESESSDKLEGALEKMFLREIRKCLQRIYHSSVILAPSFLDKLRVKYRIKASYPGEPIFTTPAAYHQIIKVRANLAEGVSYMDRKTPHYPPSYRFCSGNVCGFEDSVN
jgi:hypothetical protein